VSAVGFLHGRGVVHRDLKLENILVVSEHRLREQGARRTVLYEVKITDFGLSKTIGGGKSEAHSVVGTRPYMAPEVEDRESSYDFSSDVWCLGVLLYVLLAGQFPFDVTPTAQSEVDRIVDRLRGSDSAKPLLSGMLQLLPAGRLSLRHCRRGVARGRDPRRTGARAEETSVVLARGGGGRARIADLRAAAA